MNKYNDNVIIACDFDSKKDLFDFLTIFKSQKLFLKLGMQLLYKEGFAMIKQLKNLGHNIFIDLKINDIPNTSKNAIKQLATYKPDFISVHACNSLAALQQMQAEAKKHQVNLLAITVLTSMDDNDLNQLNINHSVAFQVETLVKLVKQANIYGVVCAVNESKIAKKYQLKVVSPAIKLNNITGYDQKRIYTPHDAKKAQVDFIVVGRAITRASSPLQAYNLIKEQFNKGVSNE